MLKGEIQTEDISIKTEDISIQSEEISIKTEDVSNQSEDISIKTENISIQSEYISIQSEDTSIKTEDISIQSEDIRIKTEEIHLEDTININKTPAFSDIKVEPGYFKTEELILDDFVMSPSDSGLCFSNEDMSSSLPPVFGNNTKNISKRPANADSSQECDNSMDCSDTVNLLTATDERSKLFPYFYREYAITLFG